MLSLNNPAKVDNELNPIIKVLQFINSCKVFNTLYLFINVINFFFHQTNY